MIDVGLTHVALPVTDIEQSIQFYSDYAQMHVIHRRLDAETGVAVLSTGQKVAKGEQERVS